jgi:RNA polymerase sigma-70 factor (ECF subfamily)
VIRVSKNPDPDEHFGPGARLDDVREVTRLQIVVRARQGDADAFEALVHEHTPSVYRLARAIVGEGAARDVVQDAFLVAWRELPRLRDPDRFVPWLHRIAVNRCRSLLRSHRSVPEIQVGPSTAEAVADPHDFRVAAEARATIGLVFGGLSVDQRTVLALHYAAGLPLSAVAESLGVPTGTAKSRLNAALEAMRRQLGETRDA